MFDNTNIFSINRANFRISRKWQPTNTASKASMLGIIENVGKLQTFFFVLKSCFFSFNLHLALFSEPFLKHAAYIYNSIFTFSYDYQ